MRATWVRDLIEQAAYLDIHGGTPYPLALAMRASYVRAYFDSSMHQQRVKAIEGEQKMEAAVIGRLDTLISAFVRLGKALSRR